MTQMTRAEVTALMRSGKSREENSLHEHTYIMTAIEKFVPSSGQWCRNERRKLAIMPDGRLRVFVPLSYHYWLFATPGDVVDGFKMFNCVDADNAFHRYKYPLCAQGSHRVRVCESEYQRLLDKAELTGLNKQIRHWRQVERQWIAEHPDACSPSPQFETIEALEHQCEELQEHQRSNE